MHWYESIREISEKMIPTYEHQLEKFKKLQTKVRFPLLPKLRKSVISAVDITLQLLKITLFINNNYATQLTLK